VSTSQDRISIPSLLLDSPQTVPETVNQQRKGKSMKSMMSTDNATYTALHVKSLLPVQTSFAGDGCSSSLAAASILLPAGHSLPGTVDVGREHLDESLIHPLPPAALLFSRYGPRGTAALSPATAKPAAKPFMMPSMQKGT